jgi:predicted DNA-binding protein
MTKNYPHPKTVRFAPDTWQLINSGAGKKGETTSAYIREIVMVYVCKDMAEVS